MSDDAKYEAERKARHKKEIAELEKTLKKYPLPPGIEVEDLVYPLKYEDSEVLDDSMERYSQYQLNKFELWNVEGARVNSWCIPVLLISKGRGNQPDRNYAIDVTGGMCRIGRGPHVKVCVTVYVTKQNKKRLLEKGFLKLIRDGQTQAGQTRDQISTRRANTAMRRGWY
jgi:hypothetical protein